MQPVLDEPWVAQYRDVPAGLSPAWDNGLAMFQATLHRDPEAPLAYYFDTTITAQRIDDMSEALAVALSARGIGLGDRVAMYLQNVPEAIATVVAVWKCGAVVVPCNPMLRERELKKILVDSGSRALICHDDLYEDVAAAVLESTAVEMVVVTSPLDSLSGSAPQVLADASRREAAGAIWLTELVAAHDGRRQEYPHLTSDDVALMVYTSGTTGVPKAATNTHGNVVFASSVYASWLDLDHTDVILGIAPLFHVTGLIGHISLTLLSGAPLILAYRFNADEACRLAEHYKATFTVSAVTAFIAILNSGALEKYNLSSLTKVYTGGAPVPPAALREWQAKAGSQLNPMYGLTEATSPTHMTPFGMTPPIDEHTGVVSVGVPVFGTHVRVITEGGTNARPGEIGELYITGPQIVPGYWQKPQETKANFTDGELHTGDVGFMDEAGFFYLVDRAKDMIVASGFKVWPREVEDVLYEHPAVREAAVVGVPDPYRGENVKAVVSLKPGTTATAAEIKSFARERMAAYKYPRFVEIMDELPKNTSGKILRIELRKQADEQLAPLEAPRLTSLVSYAELREALETRAVIELGVTQLVLGDGNVPIGRAVELYNRLHEMISQVYADGRFIDREAFLDANQAYHAYLINLAHNTHLDGAFDQLQLRGLFGDLLSRADATSDQVVLQHERLTDAVAAGSTDGSAAAIKAWAAAAHQHVKVTLGADQGEGSRRVQPQALDRSIATSAGAQRAALAEGLQARTVLEIGVVKLLNGTEEAQRLAAALLARSPLLRGSKERMSDLLNADHSFHRTLIGSLGNQILLEINESLHLPALAAEVGDDFAQEIQKVIDERSPLLTALSTGDISGAVAALQQENAALHAVLLAAPSPIG